MVVCTSKSSSKSLSGMGRCEDADFVAFCEIQKGCFFEYKGVLFVKIGMYTGIAMEDSGGFCKGMESELSPLEKVLPMTVDFYC